MARWTPTSPVGWRFGWITVVSTCQTTSSSRSGIGGSTPASALSRNRKRTVWRSGGIVRSRSKRSTAESFRTSRPSAPPWPTSWSGTTRPGVSRSLGITRRSRRARSMSYARRHSINVCPGNRVRYSCYHPGPRNTTLSAPPSHTRHYAAVEAERRCAPLPFGGPSCRRSSHSTTVERGRLPSASDPRCRR